MPIRFFLSLSTFLAVLQVPVVSVTDTNAILSVAEHLTLMGALIVAVTILWRALAEKEELIAQSIKTITEALSTAAASNIELRRIIEDSVKVKLLLVTSVDSLKSDIASWKLGEERERERERGQYTAKRD